MTPSKWEQVRARMARLGVQEDDLQESFVLGSGKGGQKVNRTSSTVQIVHTRSGRVVKAGEERSQHLNRLRARERLCDEIEEERQKAKLERQALRAKIRYKKRRPSPAEQAKRLQGKKHRGEIKRGRGRPSLD
jgi:protein subunit release factor B